MMFRQAIIWPEYFDMRLWTFALTRTVSLLKYLPNEQGISPIELYTGTKLDMVRIINEKVWGCPAYALNLRL